MVRDRAEAEAILEDSKLALDALHRLIGRLEAFTERLVGELDRREEADPGGSRR